VNPTARHRAAPPPARGPATRPVLPRRGARAARVCLLAGFFLLSASFSGQLAAQQLVTDDATIVEYRACQLEAWHGRRDSWILPACQPVRNLEVTLGAGFLRNRAGGRSPELLLQAKTLLQPIGDGRRGWALAAGGAFTAQPGLGHRRFSSAFVNLPVTGLYGYDRLYLHGNVGWEFRRFESPAGEITGSHAMTWGVRGDFVLAPRLVALAEVFGATHNHPAEFQTGLRVRLLRDRLSADTTWGGQRARGIPGAGLVVGVTFTPPPFLGSQPGRRDGAR
jgi:hypothetical protein